MSDPQQTKDQLITELAALKEELAVLKARAASAGASDASDPAHRERLAAEESLRESEELFRSVAEKSPSMIFINQGGRVVYANPRTEELLGYSVAEVCAPDFDFRCFVAPQELRLVEEMFRRHMRGEEVEQYEYAIIAKDGRRIEVFNATRLIRYGGQPAILGIVTDISDLVQARKALQESERFYRTLIETCPDSIVVIGLDGKFLVANDEAARHQGMETAEQLLEAGRTSFDSLAPEDRERTMQDFQTVLREGKVTGSVFETVDVHGERAFRESNASLIRDEHGKPQAITAVTRDITERVRAEEQRLELERQVLHAQKLESLGILAGGIAHDFNNLLTGILGSASLGLRALDDPVAVRKHLERIRGAAQRAADLTGQMLAYSGKCAREMKIIRVEELVHEMGELLRASMPKKVRLRIEQAEDLPPIRADSAQLQQVVMNLLTNAAESIGDEVGEIAVRIGLVPPDHVWPDAAQRAGDPRQVPHLFLEVTDSGSGMDEATCGRIFDPFFSTKFAGRGLGLAAVMGIVRGHDGAIQVDSEPGRGTTVGVFFPAEPSGTASAQISYDEAVEPLGPGTVLIVDDEQMIRDVAAEMVEALGLTALTANDGRHAIEIFRNHASQIDAVLLDLTMPELSGDEALRAIREVRADVPVILSSGFAAQEAAHRSEGIEVVGFVQKPYRLAQLARLLRLALG